jgi:hypothetical protein
LETTGLDREQYGVAMHAQLRAIVPTFHCSA